MRKKSGRQGKTTGNTQKGTIFRVSENAELMAFLTARMPEKSRNKIKSLLHGRQVLVDGQPVSQFNLLLTPGQEVNVTKERHTEDKKPKWFTIIYEDNDLIVIDKQIGLLSMATEKDKRTAYSMLSEYVKEKNPRNRIFIVHRLDRETSGLMMFAKHENIQHKLRDNWDEAITERTYIALVEGRMEKKEDTIVSYLSEDKSYKVHSSPDPEAGKKAITHYTTLKSNRYYSLLKVNLETGRKNQIRVHMQEIGHPVAGDKKYGAVTDPLKRLGLHARQLAFIHPVTGENMNFETEIPKMFLQIFV